MTYVMCYLFHVTNHLLFYILEATQDRLSELREEEANIREKRQEHALTVDIGTVHLINIATDQLEEKVEKRMRKD